MKPYLYLLLLGLLAACAPRTLHLTPIAQEYGTDGDRRVVRQWRDGLKIVTSYDGRWGDFLLFDTEMANESDSVLEISPANFTVQGLDAQWSVVGDAFTKQSLFPAADPDGSVRFANDQLRRAERRQRFNRIFNTVLLVATITADIASATSSDAQRNPNRYVNNRIAAQTAYEVLSFKAIADRQQYANNLDRWGHYRWVFQNEPLRKVQLAPGEGIRGRVYVPVVAQANYVRLNYPAQTDPFTFVFEQKRVKERRR